ncbi:electron transport complex protein RnfA [Thermosulfuriphilus ammonigenes]|nr:Rnf-Nqr domain containing protein [Thermosulfuriphilus ammonigenes]MBA2849163.1 electron transport complex protein RnfA [Thermosulfuriphilus ammonigenes]
MRALGKLVFLLLLVLMFRGESSCWAAQFIKKGSFKGEKALSLTLAGPIDKGWEPKGRVIVYEHSSPDIPLDIQKVEISPDRRHLLLLLKEPISTAEAYVVRLKDLSSKGIKIEEAHYVVRKSYLSIIMGIFLAASLVQNFVFTRYLGLCIFFGTSRRKETAVGMGISFTIVMVLSAIMAWAIYNFVLKPFHLYFLQVLVFVGIIAIFVQLLDTILRKVNPYLFKKLGVYLVLITTNCIILAVPLILADNAYDLLESLALALGAGLGFALALFLMATVRERLELANVPEVFQGLPIAFITAGLFALAFLGFSGLNLF